MRMAKILVTGACGLIGEKICSGLLKRDNNEIIGTDKEPSEYNEGKERYTFVKAGARDRAVFEELFKKEQIDILVHCACTADNDLTNIIKDEDVKESAAYDDYLYTLAVSSGVKKALLVSTSQVYEFPKSREPIRETDKLKIDSNYAKLKREAEKKFGDVIKTNPEVIGAALRVAPVYTSDFTDNLLAKIYDPENDSLYVYYSGDYGFHFCCLHNLVEFIMCYIKYAEDRTYSGLYNIADTHICSARDIISFARARKTYGAAVQRNVNKDKFKNMLGKFTSKNDQKTNYRYNDMETFFNNNVLDGTRARKLINFKWNLENTK
jgi:UDP-glucose 4-epimerase